ncbi:FecR family protein [Mucilaginibacter lappiensis]|uniref:Ferric-dicitrate binding protein FerR (Iron transport regulator) n=1 Tax=Mucilaginibacter lappiensis TaxID=354630 RepID=A0ABR6PTT4_9SPHI|nr:FecR domain-containing protein [Mucilaginibacter lappiensis]MBB6112559.1 ferric-dicitrate binding protein FerR (iron transport regulator) [Mucilaginibacter lappiensis]SIS03126.1 FecR family protein [Mucilaginibacter lappiensis]
MKQDMSEDILIKYILGEASTGERQEIETWKRDSDANAKKFEEVKIILETSKRLAQASPLGEAEAWEKFKEKRAAPKREPAKVVPMRRNTNWLQIAAAAVLVLGGGWIGYYLYQQNAATQVVNIQAKNQVRVDTLPDGSVVHLNKNSGISYVGTFKSKREITLTGEAFFDVKHNEAAPFTVHVNDVTIKDVGTAFNVKSKEHNTQIIVESGIVQVTRSNNAVRLNRNEMVSINPEDKQLKVEKSTDNLYGYYKESVFNANAVPLSRLIDVLNQAYNANIKIENAALRNIPITIPIKWTDPLSNVLNAIKGTTPAMKIIGTGNNIIIQ